MQTLVITKNDCESIKLIVGAMGFILIHELYPDGSTHVFTLSPREARALMTNLTNELPAIERRMGITT